MENLLCIKGRVLGKGKPLVCVPVMGKTKEEIIKEAKRLVWLHADMIEWRVDAFENARSMNAIREVLDELKPLVKDTILVYTFRSKNQGGLMSLEPDEIYDIHQTAAETDIVDFVDLEYFEAVKPEKEIRELQEMGVHVIASHHDFDATPDDRILRMLMEQMQQGDLSLRIEKPMDIREYEAIRRQFNCMADSIEQLVEEKWYSPFPQFQTTQRPDRAALAVMEGRVVLLSDNSPVALILPTDLNSFLKTSDDYYNRCAVATFARILRYMAAFLSMTLPGLYLAVTNFHTQILPTPLLLSFWEARIGVPFPAALEVVLMEISFELLREAGVRLPGAMGNTIGIVGGLIIGQAAVDANLVSPIVVIVVAFTALCSFSIPNEEFAFSFRILKFYMIALSAWLGFFGFLLGLLTILIHLSHLKSFGIPYLMPFTGADLSGYEDMRDTIWRAPLRMMTRRPIYARRGERVRLRKNKGAGQDVFK